MVQAGQEVKGYWKERDTERSLKEQEEEKKVWGKKFITCNSRELFKFTARSQQN